MASSASLLDSRLLAWQTAAMRKPVHIALAVLLVAVAARITPELCRQREPVFAGLRIGCW
jgi:hypothetical protein